MPSAEPMLPWRGKGPTASGNGMKAAANAAVRRPSLQARYLEMLENAGRHGFTDHEASDFLRAPVSSICSTRNGVRRKIRANGSRKGPWHEANTVWVLAKYMRTKQAETPLLEEEL